MKVITFLFSCLLAFTAGHMVNYSVIFLSLEWFDSHALAGLGFGLCFGPPIILGWFAGVYCDRYSPRHVLLIAQNSFFITLILLYFAVSQPASIQMPLLLIAALFSGIGWSFVAPARFATLPYYLSPNKLAVGAIALNLMVMTGFGLAPMLLKHIEVGFGWSTVFIVAALMFALSSLLLLPLGFKHTRGVKEGVFTEIKTSLQVVNNTHSVKHFLTLAIITYLLMGPMQVILPTIAENNLQLTETEQGNYLSLVALSLIIGGLLALWSKNKGKIGLQLLLAIIIAGAGIGYLGQENHLLYSIITLIITAAAGGIAVSIIVAGLQHYSPHQHRGRIMSFYTIISQTIPAASGIIAGLFAQFLSPEIALLIFSLVIIVAAVICIFVLSNIRRLEHL